jgi:hypothetical protein
MKKLTPSQQVFWEQLSDHQVTKTGQPRKRRRSREESIRQGVWTEHDEWVYNQPNRLRDLLKQMVNKSAGTTVDTGDAVDILKKLRERHQAAGNPHITGIK